MVSQDAGQRRTLLALDAGVKKFILFHHDPEHDDAEIDEMVKQASELVAKSGKTLQVVGAKEGEELLLRPE